MLHMHHDVLVLIEPSLFSHIRDTVSSVGAVRGNVMPGTNTKPKGVCYFRHALALDERRVKFEPEFVCGGAGYDPDAPPDSPDTQLIVVDAPGSSRPAVDLPQADAQQNASRPQIKEVWFAGCHSDMWVPFLIFRLGANWSRSEYSGGGNRTNNGKRDNKAKKRGNGEKRNSGVETPRSVDASAIPFLWLASEGAIMGLRHLDVQQWRVHPDLEDLKLVKPSESMGLLWKPFELLPIKRLTYEDSEKSTR